MSVHTGEHVLVVVLDDHPDPEAVRQAVAAVAVLLLLATLILWV